MRLLHTSDWHIGSTFSGMKRYDESWKFLHWLLLQLQEQKVDVLIVSGDIFDSSLPSVRSQELYYRFLSQASSVCKNIIITAGNHDSAAFLSAPSPLLQPLGVVVTGNLPADITDEVIEIYDSGGELSMIVLAVPFLKEREIRFSKADETVADKESALVEGIVCHYSQASEIAEARRAGRKIPIVAVGHLFMQGGCAAAESDEKTAGVRDLYVGKLGHMPPHLFPGNIDYFALGHLHAAQSLKGFENYRYSGAPLAMNFNEARKLVEADSGNAVSKPQKTNSVFIVDFDFGKPVVSTIEVPVFMDLLRIEGSAAFIERCIEDEKESGRESTWLEIIHGTNFDFEQRERITAMLENTHMELLQMRSSSMPEYRSLAEYVADVELEELEHSDVFRRRLQYEGYDEDKQNELIQLYDEIYLSVLNDGEGPDVED